MKHLHKFRDTHEMNARLAKKSKKEQEILKDEIKLKRLEIIEKAMDLLFQENGR